MFLAYTSDAAEAASDARFLIQRTEKPMFEPTIVKFGALRASPYR